MTIIISSQRHIDNSTLDDKIASLENTHEVTLQAWDVDGSMAILSDGHHTLEAARQLEIAVRFEVINHPEGISGEDLLEQAWMDSDWYDVETGKAAW